jgi:hypothetical protein
MASIISFPPQSQPNQVEIVIKQLHLGRWQGLDEAISNLITQRYKSHVQLSTRNPLMNKVKIHFNVFSTAMKMRIHRHIRNPHIVTPQAENMIQLNTKIGKNTLNPNNLGCTL